MKWASVFLLILTALPASRAIGDEHELYLKLTGTRLKAFNYQPLVQETTRINVKFNGTDRSYFVYVPSRYGSVMPVLVALHGAGRTGASMIDTWHALADQYSFVIIAPDGLGNNWSLGDADTNYILTLLDYEMNNLQIARGKTFLFGHSNGGKQALAIAATRPGIFARTAVHAATLPLPLEGNVPGTPPATNTVALFLGDSDDLFSLDSGRQTINWLSSLGLGSSLFILRNHGHWYYEDARNINNRIWLWLDKGF